MKLLILFFMAAIALVRTTAFAEPAAQKKAGPLVTLKTTKGDITIELAQDRAPATVKNFLDYAREGFYNGTVFHRVIPGFMIQCGGFTADMQQKKTRAPIKNEADNGLRNARGTLAMARTSDINSATSQFFINLTDNSFLDHGIRDFGYAVFGRVTAGMDVIDTIAGVATGSVGPHQNVPVEPVVINSAVVADAQ